MPVIASATRSFRQIEERLGVIKCLSQGLGLRQQARQIVRYTDEFFRDRSLTTQRLEHAMDTQFSFEVNKRRFVSWLSEDGIVRAL